MQPLLPILNSLKRFRTGSISRFASITPGISWPATGWGWGHGRQPSSNKADLCGFHPGSCDSSEDFLRTRWARGGVPTPQLHPQPVVERGALQIIQPKCCVGYNVHLSWRQRFQFETTSVRSDLSKGKMANNMSEKALASTPQTKPYDAQSTIIPVVFCQSLEQRKISWSAVTK